MLIQILSVFRPVVLLLVFDHAQLYCSFCIGFNDMIDQINTNTQQNASLELRSWENVN